MIRVNPYQVDLDKNAANYAPLTPLSLLARTAYVYPKRAAVVHGEQRYTWSDVYARCRRLASALQQSGIGAGDMVAAVMAAAVVARPDPKWGEVPCAFVELKEGAQAAEHDIIEHGRARLAHFKAPRQVVFGLLPKTSTGKIQKFILRQQAKSAAALQ